MSIITAEMMVNGREAFASHVWFTGSSQWKGSSFKLKNDGFPKCKGYSDVLVHLSGKTYMGTSFSHPAFRTNGCQGGQAGGDWTACTASEFVSSAFIQQIVGNSRSSTTMKVILVGFRTHPGGRAGIGAGPTYMISQRNTKMEVWDTHSW